MKFIANNLYHIYNQGNNQETIFKTRENYLRFLQKFRFLVSPNCEVLAYCLMPNHFHFLIQATEKSLDSIQLGTVASNKLSNGFRLLLSEYANEYNKMYYRSGSLFRQKTKVKDLNENGKENYSLICLDYIHQNPLVAGLSEDWEFSSYLDYTSKRNGTLCNKELAYNLLGITKEYFINPCSSLIKEEIIKQLL